MRVYSSFHRQRTTTNDPATVRIARNGDVTALKDQNKTMELKYDNERYLIGFVNEILAEEQLAQDKA